MNSWELLRVQNKTGYGFELPLRKMIRVSTATILPQQFLIRTRDTEGLRARLNVRVKINDCN